MKIYYLPLISIEWSKTEDSLLNHVSLDRQAHISNYYFASDQKLSLYAALLTRMAILENTTLAEEDLFFSYEKNHKPVLISDLELDFSFSHTKSSILCCLSRAHQVGADIELNRNAPLEIMSQVFHPYEIDYIHSDKLLQNKRFFEIWTRKEAYAKRNGTGIIGDLTTINTLSHSCDFFYTWEEDSYICSVCSSESSSVEIKKISEKDISNFFGNLINKIIFVQLSTLLHTYHLFSPAHHVCRIR